MTTSPAASRLRILQHPQWSGLDWLVHGFSTRPGGNSIVYAENAGLEDTAPENSGGELNLGFTPADSREIVLENRRILLNALLGEPEPLHSPQLTTVSQIHSATIHTIREAGAPPPGDGLISATPGVYLAIQTADCVPVLLVDEKQRIVAAFHAGWRGTVQKIVESGVARMRREFTSQPENMTAVIGPAIGPCCYTVGDELVQEFNAQFAYAPALFKPSQRSNKEFQLDLVEANRRQLLDAGLDPAKIHRVGACTSCHPELYFSHRQARGHTGRLMSVVGIR